MMRHRMITLAALLATAALLYFVPDLNTASKEKQQGVTVTVVWVNEKEKAVDRWLSKCAADYEKETGRRVYLRAAADTEAVNAMDAEKEGVRPDLLIAPGAGDTICLRGYALIVRDDSVAIVTPAPTSSLFSRPSPEPRRDATPAPTLDPAAMQGILAISELASAFPGAQESRDPAADLAAGKGRSALLTAGQASALTFGFQVYPLPDGGGFMTVEGTAFTSDGRDFLIFLQRSETQRKLADFGLYTRDENILLYGSDDPIRQLIESSRVSEAVH